MDDAGTTLKECMIYIEKHGAAAVFIDLEAARRALRDSKLACLVLAVGVECVCDTMHDGKMQAGYSVKELFEIYKSADGDVFTKTMLAGCEILAERDIQIPLMMYALGCILFKEVVLRSEPPK